MDEICEGSWLPEVCKVPYRNDMHMVCRVIWVR